MSSAENPPWPNLANRALAETVPFRATPPQVGVPDRRCNYLAVAGMPCNKCGRIHDGVSK